jgi:hypothetical protein
MSSHPNLIPHQLTVVFKTPANPQKRNCQKNAENHQEEARNISECPIVNILALFSSDSLVDPVIGNIDQAVNGDYSYSHIADFSCNCTILLVRG